MGLKKPVFLKIIYMKMCIEYVFSKKKLSIICVVSV